jgi:hypothetical protein
MSKLSGIVLGKRYRIRLIRRRYAFRQPRWRPAVAACPHTLADRVSPARAAPFPRKTKVV